MEKALHDRDVVGVQDFVLLENYQSEEAFLDNLKKRFQENLIYVSKVALITDWACTHIKLHIFMKFFSFFFFCRHI